MAIEVMVTQNAWNFAPYVADVYVSNKIDHNTRLIMHVNPETGLLSWDAYELNGARNDDVKPTYRIPVELLPEITRALLNHQGGIDDTRQLRKDYDHERERRNKLEDALVSANDSLILGIREATISE